MEWIQATLIFFSKPISSIVNTFLDAPIADHITLSFIGLISIVFIFSIIIYVPTLFYYWISLKLEIRRIKSLQDNGEILSESREQFARISLNCKYFDRLLIDYRYKLYTTQDISSTVEEFWSPGLLQSRMFPTVSALLTGLGVLGTFVGLLKGLNKLNPTGSVEQLQAGIKLVADGASIAFMTSVCGVALSLLFIVVEKLLSGHLFAVLGQLQRLLAVLFPPLPIMQVLVDMKEESEKSSDVLGSLATQIGTNMQTSLDSFLQELIKQIPHCIAAGSVPIMKSVIQGINSNTNEASKNLVDAVNQSGENIEKEFKDIPSAIVNGVAACIQNELAPAIQKLSDASVGLAERQATGSENALEKLIERFTERISAEGDKQKDVLNQTTEQLNNSINDFTINMNALINKLHEQQNAVGDKLQEQLISIVSAFRQAVQEELQNLNSKMESASASVKTILSDVVNSMNIFIGQLNTVFDGMNTRQNETFTRFIDDIKTNISQIVSNMGNISTKLDSSLDSMINNMESFLASLKTYQNGVTETQNIRDEKEKEYISNVFETQQKSIGNIAQIVQDHVTSTKSLLEQGASLQEKIKADNDRLQGLNTAIENASQALERASGHLEGFGDSISGSMRQGTDAMTKAVEVVRVIENRQETVTNRFDTLILQINNILHSLDIVRQDFDKVTTSLYESVNVSQEGFKKIGEHYKIIQDKLKEHMQELEEQTQNRIINLDEHMTKLLNNYAEIVNRQVSARMTEWNEQTKQFCENMIGVVTVMQSLVSDMDIKRKQK